MTTFKPNKSNKTKYLGFMSKLLLLVLVGAVVWIYQYNQVAKSRYEIREMEQEIAQLEVQNAELKNELFEITDPSRLEEVALNKGLVVESSPDYLQLDQWVSDSSF